MSKEFWQKFWHGGDVPVSWFWWYEAIIVTTGAVIITAIWMVTK